MSGRFQAAALVGATMLLSVSNVATHSKPCKKIEQGYAPGADGVRLFYRKIGTGPDVVVFLHGGPGASMQDGGHEMKPIAKDHTLIMYDQRGGGRSEIITDASRLTAADHVRDLTSPLLDVTAAHDGEIHSSRELFHTNHPCGEVSPHGATYEPAPGTSQPIVTYDW